MSSGVGDPFGGQFGEPAGVQGHSTGDRVEIGPEFKEIILGFGRPGVIRGHDHRGRVFQEVREFDFAAWPDNMPEPAKKKLRRLMHTPQWALISGCGMKAAQPLTGKWIHHGNLDYERLSRLPVIGEVRT